MSGAQNKKNKVIKQCDYSSMTYCTVIRKIEIQTREEKKPQGIFFGKLKKFFFYFFNFYLSYRVIIKIEKI